MRAFSFAAVAALGLSLVLSACDSSEVGPNPPPPEPVRLLPLEVGARWVMDYTLTDSSGVVRSTRVDTVAVVRDTVIAGERWYLVDQVGDGSTRGCVRGYFANRVDGLYQLIRRADGTTAPALYFPTTVAPGTTVDIEVSHGGGLEETATVTFVGADVPFDVAGLGTVPSYYYRRMTNSLVAGGHPLDVNGVVLDIRFSPLHGLLQQQNMYVVSRQRMDWRLRGGASV